MNNRLTLRARILLPVLSLLGVGLAAMVTAMVLMTGDEFRKSAWIENENIANRYAQQVGAELGRNIEVARTLAKTFETLKAKGITDRGVYEAVLGDELAAHPAILATWAAWDPNAFDGKDKAFAGKPGYDATGHFAPGWSRGPDGKLSMSMAADYLVPGAGDYYLVAHDSGKENFTDPYRYSYTGKKEDEVLETSFAIPLKADGKVIGVVGIDIGLDQVAALTKTIKVFETGYVIIVTNSGIRVTHPKPELVGKPIGDDTPSEKEGILSAVREGRNHFITKPNLSNGSVSLLHYAPIGVGIWEKP
jgi:methyl-accepting chemotaxis protein